MKLVWLFITAIPDLIRLLAAIEKAAHEAEIQREVRDDLKTLHQAFAAKDPAKVTALFSGVVPQPPAPDAGAGGVRAQTS